MSEIKLVCFDLNKTLIEENTWYDLNLALGMTAEEDQLLFKMWEEGIISYEEWGDILLRFYKSRGKARLDWVESVISRYTLKEGAREVIDYLKTKNYHIALISGAMDILVDKVAHDLNIEFFEANNIFVFDENNYLSDLVTFGEDELAKLRHLQSFCRKLGIGIDECVAVGDGDNDRELFEKTGRGITWKGSKLEPAAWKTIDTLNDLRTIL